MRCRTGFSFRIASGTLEEVLQRQQEVGWKAAPITDRASTFGWVKWDKLVRKAGLKPVFGVELAVTDSLHAKKPSVDYWTFVARYDLAEVNRLVELATSQFRYQPMLTYDQALKFNGFKIIGSRANVELLPFAPQTDVYLGLGPDCAKGYVRRIVEKGIQLVATGVNRYPRLEDRQLWEVICGRNAEHQSYKQHILTDEEWRESVAHIATPELIVEALANRDNVFELSNASLKKAKLVTPDKPQTLRQMCTAGAARLGIDLTNETYAARLERELSVINTKGFEDYFYIVTDICSFAKTVMLIGPGRGSSCGSLVCYLLGITAVDPLPYGLLFERFISIDRNDLPDIDLDFADHTRDLVFDYISRKYGSEHVARLGTVNLFQGRAVLRDVGKLLKLPKWRCDAVADALIERADGDARANMALEDTLTTTPVGQDLVKRHPEVMGVVRMEGHPSHAGQHAAGVVITDRPISEFVAIDARTGATMCDKKDAEALDLLKIDALGLKQLSIFEDALEMAGLPREHLKTIPLDDPDALGVLNNNRFSGIFQFQGGALQSISRQIKFERFEDLVAVTAVARPGPMASGGTAEWIKRRNSGDEIFYPHPILEQTLSETYGIAVYQEQVMHIARELGQMSWEAVTQLRRTMAKSLGQEAMGAFADQFRKGAEANGLTDAQIGRVWHDLTTHGSYSFNKSHSVAYGLVSYYCCWLKAHYPLEFAAATLSHTESKDAQLRILRDVVAEGNDYIPVDLAQSTNKWTVGAKNGKRVLIGSLSNVRGIGPKMVNQIMSARLRGEPLPDRAKKLLTDPKTDLDSLFPIRDAFARIMPDPSERQIFTPATPIIRVQSSDEDQTFLVFCTIIKITLKDENSPDIVLKRGYEFKSGPMTALNLQLADDTDSIFAKVDRYQFEKIGRGIADRGRVGNALYAIKGTIRAGNGFRMLNITHVRYIGDMTDGCEDGNSNQNEGNLPTSCVS